MSGSRLPTAAEILGALRADRGPRGRENGDELAVVGSGIAPVMAPVVALHQGNRRQWDREDDARRPGADDSEVAAAKRDIDRLNGARHGHIESIDRAIAAVLPSSDGAPLVTESPGMAIDRLSVLVIRLETTEARAAAGGAGSEACAGRLPRLRAQLEALSQAIDLLLGDLVGSRRRFVTYDSLKLYGGGAPGPTP